MNEQEIVRRLRDERPAPPAGFEERQTKLLLSLTQKEEKPVMKRKMSVALVFALILALLSVSALAASLVFSSRADAGILADKALAEQYGVTDEMLVFFHREIDEKENGETVVTYTGNWDMKYVLGTYTVTLQGKDARVTWSHDGEDTSGGLDAEAWGVEQLNEMKEIYKETHSTQGYYDKAAAIAVRHMDETAHTPAPVPTETHVMDEEEWMALQAELAAQSKLTLDELLEIARQAAQTAYGLSGVQMAKLVHNPGMSLYCEWDGRLCYQACFVLIQQRTLSSDPEAYPEYVPGDGEYLVLMDTQTGVVEDVSFYAALAGNG